MTTETFKLSRPLKTHNGEVTELTIKQATSRSYVKHGEPFKTRAVRDAEGVLKDIEFDFIDNRAMLRFLSDMIEPRMDDLLLEGLTTSDYLALRNRAAYITAFGFGDENPSKLSAD